jgi:Resolvase, N terminal domain
MTVESRRRRTIEPIVVTHDCVSGPLQSSAVTNHYLLRHIPICVNVYRTSHHHCPLLVGMTYAGAGSPDTDGFATDRFSAEVIGTTADRPQLKKLMAVLAPGDVVITTAVDRLSRDTTDRMVIAREMPRAGAGLRSLGEPTQRRKA